jgi:predicted dehydrogenase
MIRIGIVDFGTSHVIQFTKRLNHVDIEEDQFVEGGKVVMACPGRPRLVDPSRLREYTEQFKAYGVPLVDKAEEMIGKIDAVLIESQDAEIHLERVTPFLEAGIPAFVEKPFADTPERAKAMAELADKNGVAVISSSALRFTPEVVALKEDEEETGKILGASAYSPAPLNPGNPGLLHYGIHGVETLYAIMGPGCRSVRTVFTEGAEVSTGLWEGDRIGVVHGTRDGAHSYGFCAWGEKKVVQSGVDTGNLYRELLKRIVKTFETGTPCVPVSETVEIIAFINAALESSQNDGAKVQLKV